jgi:glycosyltransferase involved in cell wall biosynthesis
MRIAVISGASSKTALGDRIRINAILRILKNNGHEVFDIPTPSTHNLCDIFSNVFPIQTTNSLTPKLSARYVRDQLSFVVSRNYLLRQLENLRVDAVLAETTRIGLVACCIAKKLSLKCIVDVHGLGFAESQGIHSNNWHQAFTIEQGVFQEADHLIVVSDYMKTYLQRSFGIDNRKISVASNGGEIRSFSATFQFPLKVIFAGSFAYWEKVDDVLEIAKTADSATFKFYLAGAGPLERALLYKIKNENIPITYLGYVSRKHIYRLLSKMQVGLAPSTRDLARKVASPIKIFDYMSCGLPIVCSKVGDWGKLVSEYNCGFALEDDSIVEYAKALARLARRDVWTKLSENAQNVMKDQCTWEQTLKPIVDSFDTL